MCGAGFVTPIDDENMKPHRCGKDHDPTNSIHQCVEEDCGYQWVSEEWVNPNG